MRKELLESFIDWLREKEDVFYAFDDTMKAINEFLEETGL